MLRAALTLDTMQLHSKLPAPPHARMPPQKKICIQTALRQDQSDYLMQWMSRTSLSKFKVEFLCSTEQLTFKYGEQNEAFRGNIGSGQV